MTTDRPADDLGPFVTNAFGDRYLPAVVGPVFRDRPARDVYDERFKDTPFEEHSLYVVCGTDSGLFPRYLEQTGIPKGTRFLFVEDPEVLAHLRPERSGGGEIAITTIDEFERMAADLELEKHFYRNSLYLIPSFCTLDPNNVRYAELAWVSMQKINTLSLRLGVRLQNRQFLTRIIENLGENRVSVNALRGVFRGRTAVLLGGGPSLDDILPWVAENRDRVVVLAVSRISRQLLAAGIVPDLVFSIDPQPVSYELSKDMLRFGEDTLFVNNTHVATGLLAQWTGRSAYWGPRLPWLPWEHPMPGSTVTHLGLWTAIHMGFSQVVLGGVDLCFSREGYTHATGSQEREAGPTLLRGQIEVETNDGGKAETDRQMGIGIQEMASLAEHAARNGCRVVNPAPTAARIRGISHDPLDTLRLEDTPVRAKEVIARALPPETGEDRARYYRNAIAELDSALEELREIRRVAARAIRDSEKLLKATSPAAHHRLRARLDAAEKELRTTYHGFRTALMQLNAPEWVKVLKPERDDWTPAEVEQAGQQIFELYQESAHLLAEVIRSGRQRLLSRLAEEDRATDAAKLLDRWEEEGVPGRVRVWQARNPSAVERARQNPEISRHIDRLLETFWTRMDTAPKFGSDFQLGSVLEKAAGCFHRRDPVGLERLEAGLAKQRAAGAGFALHLVRGFLAELAGDTGGALESYGRVADTEERDLLVEALKRIAAIELGNRRFPEAVAAMERLADLAPAFRPQYANVLRLAGQPAKALNVCMAHVADQPGDLEAFVQLGRLQLELGVPAAAAMALRHVLEHAPLHAKARQLLVEAERQERSAPPSS